MRGAGFPDLATRSNIDTETPRRALWLEGRSGPASRRHPAQIPVPQRPARPSVLSPAGGLTPSRVMRQPSCGCGMAPLGDEAAGCGYDTLKRTEQADVVWCIQ